MMRRILEMMRKNKDTNTSQPNTVQTDAQKQAEAEQRLEAIKNFFTQMESSYKDLSQKLDDIHDQLDILIDVDDQTNFRIDILKLENAIDEQKKKITSPEDTLTDTYLTDIENNYDTIRKQVDELRKSLSSSKDKDHNVVTQAPYILSLNELIKNISALQTNYTEAFNALKEGTPFYKEQAAYANEINELTNSLENLLTDVNKKNINITEEIIKEKKAQYDQVSINAQKRITVMKQIADNKEQNLEKLTRLQGDLIKLQETINATQLELSEKAKKFPDEKIFQDSLEALKSLTTSLQGTSDDINSLHLEVENDNIVLLKNGTKDLEPQKEYSERAQALDKTYEEHVRRLTEIANNLKGLKKPVSKTEENTSTLESAGANPTDGPEETAGAESTLESADEEAGAGKGKDPAKTNAKKHHIRTRIYSDTPTMQELASGNSLTSDERYNLKKPESYLNMILYIERNYKFAKDARSRDELEKMQEKCIHILEVLKAYKVYLDAKGNYTGSKKDIIDECLAKLDEPNGLLFDDAKLGPNADITGKIASISTDVYVADTDDQREAFRTHLTDWNIYIPGLREEGEPDDPDVGGLSLESGTKPDEGDYHTSDTFNTRYTHMLTNADEGNKETHYVTAQTEVDGHRIARFYMDSKLSPEERAALAIEGRHDVGWTFPPTQLPVLGETRIPTRLTIPNDHIMAWAITQVEDFLHDNPHSHQMRLTGNLGNFTEDHIEAIMLYAKYKRDVEGSGLFIKNETGIEKPIVKKQVEGFLDRLKNADISEDTCPYKGVKQVVARTQGLGKSIDRPKKLMINTDSSPDPVTYVSKPRT